MKTETTSKQGAIADRSTAISVGVLIIAGYLTYGIPEGTILQPILSTPDPLTNVAAQPTYVIFGALIMAINSAAVVGIAVLLYPVLKQYNETIAIGYLATRIFESVALIIGVIALLLLVPLSQEYVQAGAADAASLQAVSILAIQTNLLAYHIGMMGLAIGSLPFCYLLYRSKLVPRFISVLGLVGYPALLIFMIVEIFGVGIGPILYLLYIPGGLFEIGLAVWLIVKGFNSSPIISGAAKTDLHDIERDPAK